MPFTKDVDDMLRGFNDTVDSLLPGSRSESAPEEIDVKVEDSKGNTYEGTLTKSS